MTFQLLLTLTFDDDGNYTIKADTNLPNDEAVKKTLRDALALMNSSESKQEDNTSTYLAASPGDKEAGLVWPEPDARPKY